MAKCGTEDVLKKDPAAEKAPDAGPVDSDKAMFAAHAPSSPAVFWSKFTRPTGPPTALAPAGSSTVNASGTASSETPAKWTPASEPAGSPSDGTLPVPVLAVQVPPVPVSMPSLSETGSEGMPMALPSPESMTVVLSARDACQPQNARG